MKTRIKIIDASRGIAAIIVLVHHFMTFYVDDIKSVTSTTVVKILSFISDLNTEAVLFFFIISGFCIGLSQKGKLPISKEEIFIYTKKRLIRILPIYFLVLFITFLVGVFTNSIHHDSNYDFSNFIGNLFFLQTPEGVKHWFTPYGHNGPLWSLSYEMFFYAFFPIFSYFLVKTSIKNINLIFILLSLITVISLIINYFKLFTPWFSFLSLFIIWYYGYLLLISFVNQQKNHFHFIFIFCISVVICLNKIHIPSDTVYQAAKGLIIVSLLYGVILIHRINKIKIVLNKVEKFIIFLFYQIGMGSYAIYAFHYIVLMMCAYFELTLIETIILLTISIICCIQLEKLIIQIAARRFNPNRQISKEIYPLK